ncbi:MAG: beta-N-acetylhexosaminidase [Saprospiraceae bacterium]|nr:beta-N-acetylhexosaminidase [Saprospiraceae bacterium]
MNKKMRTGLYPFLTFANISFFCGFIFIPTLCGFAEKTSNNPHNFFGIIPAPAEIKIDGGKSQIETITISHSDELSAFASQLIKETEGFLYKKSVSSNTDILIDTLLGNEEYILNIEATSIIIKGGSKTAVQYAITSLVQMVRHNGFPLPLVSIQDYPCFVYRGKHLDVCRHFFSIEEVKKYLDFMAYYKFNHFHWHLTEDQGWRIEIKKYPKLQDVAAYRNETLIGHYNDTPHKFDGKRYGGYYTQKEIKDLVSFAEGRNIHVIPEIEMPGHALAALAAYPELGCSGGPYKVATKWGVFEEVFCPTENTFAFLYDVLDEVISLFPYKYIHIGGDECPKSSWQKSSVCQKIIKENGLKDEYELQSYFIKKIEKYITSKGRQIIGWDEILEGGLAPGATVMSWRGTEGGIEAARLGHDVIMTPGSFCYFDHYQSTSDKEPLAIGGYTSLEKVYHWKPIPETLEPPYKKHILGGQANVWTEYIQDFRQVEYMAYARGLAMSEALWTTPGDYKEFTGRFLKHNDYWKTKGVNIANHVFELKPKIMAGKGKPVKISFDLPMEKQVWHEWSGNSKLGNEFDLIDKGLHHFSLDATTGTSRSVSVMFNPHLATKAKISMSPSPSEKYPGQGPGSIVNGLTGSENKYGGTEWLGFEGKDLDILLEWKNPEDIRSVNLRFFKAEGQWIYLPSSVEIYASANGKVFEQIRLVDNITSTSKTAEVKIQAVLKGIRFIKIRVNNFGMIPSGAQGAGHKAWLFVDEVVVD